GAANGPAGIAELGAVKVAVGLKKQGPPDRQERARVGVVRPLVDVLQQHRAGRRAVAPPQLHPGRVVVRREQKESVPRGHDEVTEPEVGGRECLDGADERRARRRAVGTPQVAAVTYGVVDGEEYRAPDLHEVEEDSRFGSEALNDHCSRRAPVTAPERVLDTVGGDEEQLAAELYEVIGERRGE